MSTASWCKRGNVGLNLFALSQSADELSDELITLFTKWSEEIEGAAPLFALEGERLESLCRDLPQHQAHYALRAQEAKALVKWLEVEKAKLESRHLKNYNQSPRALGVREQAVYLSGEKDIVQQNQLIVEANLRAQQFEEIVESFKQMGWQLGNITKARVAELNDIVV